MSEKSERISRSDSIYLVEGPGLSGLQGMLQLKSIEK